jgi:hypothetical protein
MTIRSLNTQRVARHRERRRDGLASFSFVADEVSVKVLLEDLGLLKPDQYDDVAAIGVALNGLITLIMKERLPNDDPATDL